MNRMIKVDKNKLEELYVNQRLDGRHISKILGVSPWTIWNRLKIYGLPVRRQIPHPKFSFSGNLEEKAYILGFRTGDLYAIRKSPNCIKVESSSSQPVFLKTFGKIFSKYGILKVYERHGNITEKTFKILCYLDSSFEFLINKLDKIPQWIIESDKHFFAFLAGYIDAEGSWIIANHRVKKWNYKDSIFSLGSCNKAILEQIHQKLKELGFNSHLYLTRKKGTKTQIGKYNSDFYRIRIYGKNVEKLAKIILPIGLHEDKQKDMSNIIRLEKTKIEKLGTINIPCLYCNHKNVSKSGSYLYKNVRYQRYRCPICKKIFSEQTIKRVNKKGVD